MPSPPIQVFLTTIASQPALRQRQEYILRILQVKKITFTSYDLASDEAAKRLWKRKAPADKQQLPGILVGGQCPGAFSDFEDAVEYGELDTFLRLKETWVEDEDRPQLPAQVIGVPGAASPLQMTPEHLRSKVLAQSPSPLKGKGTQIPVNKKQGEFDISTELEGYGLQGVRVTEDELADLVAELGLDGDDAGDLVKGLQGLTGTSSTLPADVKAEEPKITAESTKAKDSEVLAQPEVKETVKSEGTKSLAASKVDEPKVEGKDSEPLAGQELKETAAELRKDTSEPVAKIEAPAVGEA